MKPAGITLLSLFLAGTAQAAEVYLDDVTLTAARTPQQVSRSGVSVSVVTGEELEAAGAIQLVDYLARLPGVSVTQSGPAGSPASRRIRGSDPRHVAVFVDGLRVGDPSNIGGEFDFGALATADIGRVEVLRGAQGALWGSQAMGGVIHITTRAAGDGAPGQSAGLELGTGGHLATRYTAALQQGRAATVFNLSYQRSDGFSAVNTLPYTPGLERDGTESTRFSLSTRYQASPDLVFGLAAFAQRSRADYDSSGWDFATNSALPLPNSDSRAQRAEQGGRVYAEVVRGNTTHLLDLGLYRIDRQLKDAAYGAVNGYAARRHSASWQAVTQARTDLQLVYGAEYTREQAGFGSGAADSDSRTRALWGQALWQPRDGVDVTAGLRRDQHSRFGGHSSGRLALAWAASDQLTLRGAVATGFLAPSLYQMYGDVYVVPNFGLTPEESRSLELGLDYRTGKGGFGATLFRLDSDNAIDWGGLGYANLPGRSRRQGLELSGDLALSDAVSLTGAYTYTQARTPQGGRLARVPRHNLSLGVTAALSPRLQAQGQLTALAGRPHDSGQRMASYALLGASVSYSLSAQTRLTARVENLTNRRYQSVAGYGTPPRGVFLGLSTRF